MTSCQAKPDCSLPGCPPRRLLTIVNWSVNWFACVNRIRQLVCLHPEQQLHFLSYIGGAALASVMRTNYQCVDWRSILPIKLVATATSLEGSEKQLQIFHLQPYATVPVNSVKIGQYIDAEIIGLTEVVKNIG